MTLDQTNYQLLVQQATERWADAEPVDSTVYTVTQGLPGSQPRLPIFQGTGGPDDEYSIFVGGYGADDNGEWKLYLGLESEPDRCKAAGVIDIGGAIECGDWAIRAVAAWDGGGSFMLLAHPDLPEWTRPTTPAPSPANS